MEQIKKLLEQISEINMSNKKNAEILDAKGERFNMFRVCGVDYYENTHSAILAEFFNPDGSHGLKSKLLECFIEKLTIPDFDCTDARVYREYHTGDDGRIDILIENKYGHALILENKIYAGDQWKQLKRYDTFAEKKYGKGKYQIFYMTLFGKDASEQSGEGVDYATVSYKTDIIGWLEQCVPIAEHFPMVRETIKQYINHLKQLTHQDMDAKNKEKIIDMIVSDKQLIESADYVVQIWKECRRKILINVMENATEVAKELGLECKFDVDDLIGPKGNTFSFYKEGWDNYCILFEFNEEYELHVGVIKRDLSWDENDLSDQSLKRYLSDFKIKDYAPYEDAWAWGIKWDSLSLSEFPKKLSYEAIKEAVEIILKKLDDFKA
jgi:hypothetical protein